jgi:hypothetical protein
MIEQEETMGRIGWHLCRAVGLGAIALSAIGCDDDNDVLGPVSPGGSGSSLTSTSSTPADGDGTLTVLGTFTADFGGSGYDELNLSEMVGGVGHDVSILWDTNTHALQAAQHGWGSGFTQCVMGTANPCDPAKVVIDFAGQTVTFTNLVLVDDVFGTPATSTLVGTARW